MKTKRLITPLIIILLTGGAYFFFMKDYVEAPSILETEEVKAPEGWNGYENLRYGFSIFYPKTLNVGEFDEGEGAFTIVFEDSENVRGFQVFIIPYNEQIISKERFLKDNPSGVQKDPRNFYVDDVQGASFYSQNPILGETYEVWFINKGYLFELATLKSTESLLVDILETWEFIPKQYN